MLSQGKRAHVTVNLESQGPIWIDFVLGVKLFRSQIVTICEIYWHRRCLFSSLQCGLLMDRSCSTDQNQMRHTDKSAEYSTNWCYRR